MCLGNRCLEALTYICAISVWACAGCVDTRVNQRLWHLSIGYAGAWVEEGAKQASTMFSAEQLRVMVGEPDYVLTVAQFARAVRNPKWPTAEIMRALNEDFARCVTVPQPVGNDRSITDKQGHALKLDQCQLWVYEENRRFPSPLPACHPSIRGYDCYVFLVYDIGVLGIAQFPLWQPLEFENAPQPG